MAAPTSATMVCVAMNPANSATTATRPMPRPTFAQAAPLSSVMALNKTKAATNTLKIAPMSAASITLTPTANPARASRVQRMSAGVSEVLETTRASAKKSMPMAICCVATPQQAVAKKVEFSVAASAPSVAASGDSFSCRKKVHAPSPKMNNAMGAKNFAITDRTQHPEYQCARRWRERTGADAKVVDIIPASQESGGQVAPRGVLLSQRAVVGKMDIARQKTFPEKHGQNDGQQRREEKSAGSRAPFFFSIFINK